jgi:hypothetical protein
MSCRSCQLSHQEEFGSEIMIHFSGIRNLDRPAVIVFPKVLICLDCGFAECIIPATELRLLGQGGAASALLNRSVQQAGQASPDEPYQRTVLPPASLR